MYEHNSPNKSGESLLPHRYVHRHLNQGLKLDWLIEINASIAECASRHRGVSAVRIL